MNPLIEDLTRVAFIGIGATAAMDIWLLFLKKLNVPTLNFAFIGRWLGHSMRGRWAHASIAKAAPIKGEVAFGWLFHYLAGIAFAGVLVAIYGMAWVEHPSVPPALAVGVGSVMAPWFIMQPAMGAGIASTRTASPVRSCMRSLANHAVFGAGLYLAAALLASISR